MCNSLLIKKFKRLLSSQNGATAIEYAIIAVLLSIVIIGGVTAIGTTLETEQFGKVDTELKR